MGGRADRWTGGQADVQADRRTGGQTFAFVVCVHRPENCVMHNFARNSKCNKQRRSYLASTMYTRTL